MSTTQAFQPTPPAPVIDVDGDDTAEQFVSGVLAKKLGLTSGQLGIGLTVARNQMTRGAYQEAFETYVGLILCEPANVDFQLGLANCASAIGQHHLAIQAASAVIALAPSNARGFLLSGRGCLAIGAMDEAKEDLTDAARLAKASGDAVAEAEARKLLEIASAARA